jgi:hypothetical protein
MSKDSQRLSILGPFVTRGGRDKPSTSTDSKDEPPPEYSAVAPENGNAAAAADEAVNVTAAFDNLKLSNAPVDPSVETCLAHLKLLSAFQWMKEDVGFTDGLWGLWDSRAGPIDPIFTRRPEKEKVDQEKEATEPGPSVEERIRNKNLEALSRVREKRWALFVARAVDRYETWWNSLARLLNRRPLCEFDMDKAGSGRYAEFPTASDSILHWTEDTLPPLGGFSFANNHLASANLSRCPHGLARSHAKPSRVPRGRHAGRDAAVLGHGHALGPCQ